MTYQELDKSCDDSRVHRGRGPWDQYIRVLRVRRQKCARPSQNEFEVFRELVHMWKMETWHRSPLARRISHPAYLKIIGLGSQAIPWILQELKQEQDYWFAALEAITREPSPNVANLSELRDAWLEWGKRHGY